MALIRGLHKWSLLIYNEKQSISIKKTGRMNELLLSLVRASFGGSLKIWYVIKPGRSVTAASTASGGPQVGPGPSSWHRTATCIWLTSRGQGWLPAGHTPSCSGGITTVGTRCWGKRPQPGPSTPGMLLGVPSPATLGFK